MNLRKLRKQRAELYQLADDLDPLKLTPDRVNESALPFPPIPARFLHGASLLLPLFTSVETPGCIEDARVRIQV
jgi:hypothetical protein